MSILIFFSLLTLSGWIVRRKSYESILGHGLLVFGSVPLLAACFTILIVRFGIQSNIDRINRIEPILKAEAISCPACSDWKMKEMDINIWIENVKFYNTTVLDIWIPDSIDSVKPLDL